MCFLSTLPTLQARSTRNTRQRMSRAESPLPFFDAAGEAEMMGGAPVLQYISGDYYQAVPAPPPPRSPDVAADASGGGRVYVPAPPPPPPPDVAADASGGKSVYVPAPPPPPRSPDIAVDTTTDAPGADPAVRRPCTCRACACARWR